MLLRKLFKVFIFLALTLIVITIYYTKTINQLLHPRLHFFILLASFLLALFVILEIIFLKKTTLPRLQISNLFYLLPLILIFFLNSGQLDSRFLENKQLTPEITRFIPNPPPETSAQAPSIVLTDENFLTTRAEILSAIPTYLGQKIHLSGFIHRDHTMASDQFQIGRLAMTCCTADANFVGFFATASSSATIQTNAWYTLTAIIDEMYEITDHAGNYHGQPTVILWVQELQPLAPLPTKFVF